jgi:hypothetical protein
MKRQKESRYPLLLLLVLLLIVGGATGLSFAKDQTSNSARSVNPSPSPSPSPRPTDEVPQDSDEVVKVETNLTNLFFTAADRSRRFVNTLKAEDIRVLEDGQPQEIFTFPTKH